MKRVVAMVLLGCLLLCGCSGWLDGHYVSVKPHEEQDYHTDEQILSVSSYSSLRRALGNMVWNGAESAVISVANYNQLLVSRDTRNAVTDIMENDPIGVYAVENIQFELGTSAGKPAIAVRIQYIHDGSEIKKIRQTKQMSEAKDAVAEALDNCDSGIVMYVEQYEQTDLAQWVENYGSQNPDKVMEVPSVTVNVYPDSGENRVVELKFLYQNSRESLRTMKEQVASVMEQTVANADIYGSDPYAEIYNSLMNQVAGYQQETSLTAAYSLLVHGVGDAKAFASVYAALCRRAGLECMVLTGTRAGEPWSWNVIESNGVYYHVDLLRCSETGAFQMKEGTQMPGYVWDFSAFPVE